MPYPVGTVVGRYSECYCLTQGGEGDHDRVLPQHRQLHLLIHLQMKKPVLSRTLLLLSLPSPTHQMCTCGTRICSVLVTGGFIGAAVTIDVFPAVPEPE